MVGELKCNRIMEALLDTHAYRDLEDIFIREWHVWKNLPEERGMPRSVERNLTDFSDVPQKVCALLETTTRYPPIKSARRGMLSGRKIADTLFAYGRAWIGHPLGMWDADEETIVLWPTKRDVFAGTLAHETCHFLLYTESDDMRDPQMSAFQEGFARGVQCHIASHYGGARTDIGEKLAEIHTMHDHLSNLHCKRPLFPFKNRYARILREDLADPQTWKYLSGTSYVAIQENNLGLKYYADVFRRIGNTNT